MSLIKSHSYTINLSNVNYFKPFQYQLTGSDGTQFTMNNDKCVTITCPYDVVIHQLAGSSANNGYAVKVVKLNY